MQYSYERYFGLGTLHIRRGVVLSGENLLFELGNEFIEGFELNSVDDDIVVWLGKSIFISCLEPLLKKSIIRSSLKDNSYVRYYNSRVLAGEYSVGNMVFSSGSDYLLYSELKGGVNFLIDMLNIRLMEKGLDIDKVGVSYSDKVGFSERVLDWLDSKGISVMRALGYSCAYC